MKYQIVTAFSAGELMNAVTELIAEGWQLQGGVSVAESDYYSQDHEGSVGDNYSRTFAQAVVYRKKWASFHAP